jgi:hypothetical protein
MSERMRARIGSIWIGTVWITTVAVVSRIRGAEAEREPETVGCRLGRHKNFRL